MRLTTLLIVVFTTLSGILFTFGGVIVTRAILDVRDVRRAMDLSETDSTAIGATVAMSLERSVVQVALALEDPIPDAFRDIVTAQRDTANAGLAEALAQAEALGRLETQRDYISQTRKSLERVAELRAEADALLALPRAQRDPERATAIPVELKDEVVRLRTATDLLRGRVDISSQTLNALQNVQLKSWEVREFGGRARTYFAIATLNEAPISIKDTALLTIDSARASEAWQSLKNSVASVPGMAEEVISEISMAEESYFGRYGEVIADIAAVSEASAGAGSARYKIGFADFFALSNAALGAMESLSQNSGTHIQAYWTQRQNAALVQLYVSIGVLLLAAATVLIAFTFIWKHIGLQIGATTGVLSSLSAGDLNVEIKRSTRELVEIRELHGAVEAFRDAVKQAKDAEAEARGADAARKAAEHDRAEAERAHMQERTAEAERAQEEVRTQQQRERNAATEIAQVVEACAAGDFSRRLVIDDKDGIFREICDGLNRIGEAADTGLGAVKVALNHLAEGDLTHRMPDYLDGVFHEIAVAMNATTQSLGHILGDVAQVATSVDGSAASIFAATTDLTTRSEVNATRIERTAQDLGQLSENIQSAASSAQNVRNSVDEISKIAHDGNDVILRTMSAMDEIRTSSNEITQVLKMIDDIAFQTNLLALNAGVEAARAGTAGRGFAVVASEVRALAQRASDAAQQIGALVQTSGENVAKGVELAEASGSALENIVAGVENVTAGVGQIVTATDETSSGIKQIAGATSELDEDVKRSGTVFRTTNEAASSLQSEARRLKEAVGAFKTERDTLEAPQLLAS